MKRLALLCLVIALPAAAGKAPSKERIQEARAQAEMRQRVLDDRLSSPAPEIIFDSMSAGAPRPVAEPAARMFTEEEVQERLAMAELNASISLLLEAAEASEAERESLEANLDGVKDSVSEINATLRYYLGGGAGAALLFGFLLKIGWLQPGRKKEG